MAIAKNTLPSDNGKSTWPKTSDKEFSKRVCRAFMWAFFIQTLLTHGVGIFLPTMASGALDVYVASQPAYMLVFGAVIAKSGVENVFKGKTSGVAVSMGTDANEDATDTEDDTING